ncbi:uncharacterized protein LOC114261382 [Camellia sinensis]|uniref:uncharacterized protein LOC114261382 n=1 Tax=Camellia sinensis TaxID=4442 RepID=UPI001035E5C3|nr:uncharacterized protein LOC114261382 [Camellia sinensis]
MLKYIYIYIYGSQTTTDQRLCISLFSVSLYLSHYTASATPLLFSPPSLTALHQPCLRHSSSRSPTAGASIASSLSLCAVRILTQNLAAFLSIALPSLLASVMTIAADTSGSPTRLQLGSVTSGKEDIGNYTGICIIVATLGVADGHVQGGMVGDLSFMCPTFIQVSLSKCIISFKLIIFRKTYV